MDNLSQWCFQISRSIFDSKIFSKPAEWLKVWIYIIWQMNFKDNWLPRWSKYMKYERIERDCKVSYNIITKIVVFLKKEEMISVKQATHWCIITVLNYAVYQDIWSYEGKPQANHRQTTGNSRVDNINKNERMKEWKNIYGSFENVKLKLEEYEKIQMLPDRENKIEDLSLYIKSKWDKYKDHYATILARERKNSKTEKEKEPTTQKERYELMQKMTIPEFRKKYWEDKTQYAKMWF